jgi:alpha-amylase/alpha-mannosidase (GH57 family)
MTDLVIHGHFYQPPRENPWTGVIEREPKVHPFHDWNERIHHECYRTNAFARILDHYQRIEQIVNNFERISFNFGPTLLSWLEGYDKTAYDRILKADRISAVLNHGHGNAIAQAYNHAILPLCNERDRVTQVRWGVADFRHRFGREPEAMWLPETACNDATLSTLIDEGLSYTILSPYQAERVRPLGHEAWTTVADGSIDPGIAYRYFHRDGSGRSIALFFYDGPIARSIAFEGVLASSQTFVSRLLSGRGGPDRIIHVATDGESYGHHFRLGELTLAHATAVEAPARGVSFTNYGAFLEAHPPTMEVEIKPGPSGEGTSWSCSHGVGRWYRDCGCSTNAQEGWNQGWRSPLRNALDFLRDHAARLFEEGTAGLVADPWAARNAYIELVLAPDRPVDEWIGRHAVRPLDDREKRRVLSFLELERSAMLMYTSCGWFFADISGTETVQILSYAGRALDWLEELGLEAPRARFLEILSEARSNIPELGSGADVFARFVEPQRVTPQRIASHLAISSLVEEGDEGGVAGGYRFKRSRFQKQRHGRLRLATSRLEVEHALTGQRHDYAVGSMHLGGVDFYCAIGPYPGKEAFNAVAARVWSAFRTASLPTMLRILQQDLGPDEGGLESLLPDGRERISELVFGNIVGNFVDEYGRMYETNQRVLEQLQEAGFELPKELRAAAEFALGRRFMQEITNAHASLDPAAYKKAVEIADEALRRGYEIDRSAASRLLGEMIAGAIARATESPIPARTKSATALIELARRLRADAHFFRAQEIFFQALGERGSWPEAISALAIGLGFAPTVVGRRDSLVAQLQAEGEPPASVARSFR